jgi:hypothetical protein
MTLLENAANSFLNAPSGATQDSLRPVFKNAYLSFERVSIPFFGPASSISANRYINSFPTSTFAIETGIQGGVYDFTVPGISDTIQGLPALDYLLFSADAVTRFSAADAANRKQYVRDVIARIKQLSQATLTQWNGGYRAVFISSLKTDVGSSIGLVVNQFAAEMDAMKGPRIGWPFGKQSNGIVFADNFVTASDRRLKTDVTPLLPTSIPGGYRFSWLRGGGVDVGCMADEVEAVLPECVTVGADGFRAVDYARLVPYCFTLIRDLRDRVEALESRDPVYRYLNTASTH